MSTHARGPLTLLIAIGAVVSFWALRAPRQPLPHVIVYLIDTLRADHLGAYGYERTTSPAIDAFARDAVLFRHAYTQSSWTRPAVATLFTGLMPSRHGAIGRRHGLRRDVETMAEVFHAHGYSTAAFISNPNLLPVFGFERGFDTFQDIDSTRRGTRADEVHAAVLSYLGSRPDGPLFLYVHIMDPHRGYDPPPPFLTQFGPEDRSSVTGEIDRYDGEIAYADHEFGEFLNNLRREHLFARSLIVLLSDHGEEFHEHGHDGHGRTLYQEQLLVPVIIRTPNGPRGLVVERPVRVVDIMATLCELLDFTCAQGTDGRSFLSLFATGADRDYRPSLYAELDLDSNAATSLVDKHYKLIRRTFPTAERGDLLFDLNADPEERNDLAAEKPDVMAALQQRIASIESSLGAGIYLEFANGSRLDESHVFAGTVGIENGEITVVSVEGFALDDGVRASPDRRHVSFTVPLENRRNPIEEYPPILTAMARIRFSLQGDEVFRLDLALDGERVTNDQLILGSSNPAEVSLPTSLSSDDPRLVVESRSFLRAVPGHPDSPLARIYAIPRVSSATVHPDESVREQLRELGYLHDDSGR